MSLLPRILVALTLFAAIVAGAFLGYDALDSGDERAGRYTVVMDNAFGLIEGADVKVAGVRAGQITTFEIDPKSYRARVGIRIDRRGFGTLRSDVFCESRPQSLIGEYFLDCEPGTKGRRLKAGATIPVSRTGSTIPVDLVNNIMRRPFRERFSILLGELGAAFTARGEDLNETIRRANPALRETDKVLAQLAEQRTTIRDLTTNADRVVTRLARDKKEISRFVREARDTSRTSASRRRELRGQVRRFPAFLDELKPTMARLGEAADAQVPALTTLSAQAPLLTSFFEELGPFSEASRPAFRTLASASRAGRPAVSAARPRIGELRALTADLPELAGNLAPTLEHLDDRRFATEKNPDSPGGEGFTGYEAILQYVFRQSQATNVFDGNSYLLKVSAFLDNLCAQYTTAEQAKDPDRKRCRANLGPNQPGVDTPDPTAGPQTQARKRGKSDDGDRKRGGKRRPKDDDRPDAPDGGDGGGGDGGGGGSGGGGSGGDGSGGGGPNLPGIPDVDELVPDVPGLPTPPSVPDVPGVPGVPSTPAVPGTDRSVLDFLFGP